MDILYSAKFLWVFHFVNFQPFAKLFQRKIVTRNTCNSVDGQHATESTRDTLQRDTFERGTALLIAVSLSVDNGVAVHIRERAYGKNS